MDRKYLYTVYFICELSTGDKMTFSRSERGWRKENNSFFFVYRLPSFPSFSFAILTSASCIGTYKELAVGNDDDERETASDV